MVRPLSEIFLDKPTGQLKIYAWWTSEVDDYLGLLKVGQTTKDVRYRIRQSQAQMPVEPNVVVEEPATRPDGSFFTDRQVRDRLKAKGFKNPKLEWMECSKEDVLAAINELRNRTNFDRRRDANFPMRKEQSEAVQKTASYFQSIWNEDSKSSPRFLWNAKMRFGKTFASYQLAKRIGAKRVLVVTFKPAVEDAWQVDLETHVDFDGWQYFSKTSGRDPRTADKSRPLVYFGSFQDLLGRDRQTGRIKPKNEWIHTTNWDLVVFDEYHFGAWRENAKELFEGEDESGARREFAIEYDDVLDEFEETLQQLRGKESDFLPITSRSYLYLSGTPFRALASGEFIEEQIFNWTYSDEQRAKADFSARHPDRWNPYAALPEMRLLTYRMPDELIAIAAKGEFNEFDLNSFFEANGADEHAEFRFKTEVQKWLSIIRGSYAPTQVDDLRAGSPPPFPYSDARILPYLQHSVWFLPDVASCNAMANLLAERQNSFFHDYQVLVAAGTSAGIGVRALKPVREAIGSGHGTKTITLTCGKLTTGVTVPQWSSILMLKNLDKPESYFQAAFRVQSSWSMRNPNGDNPHEEEVFKPICFVFDFEPNRALRQFAEYGQRLAPEAPDPERAVAELIAFLPVLAYDNSRMIQVDAGALLDFALAGVSATLLAKKWDSPVLVNVDNDTLRRIMDNAEAMAAIMKIEGFRKLGSDIFETVVNKSEALKRTKRDLGDKVSDKKRRELTEAEKEYKSKRKQIQDKLIKFATRIPAFMYLTDFRENTIKDVITLLEPDLFNAVTGLTVSDFELLMSLGVFNSAQMNQAVFAFRRYEDSSLSYTGIDSHPRLRRLGLFDTVIAVES